jgi:tol-pal system protein YbgF
MNWKLGAVLSLAVLMAVLSGCATGGSQLETTVYDTHRRIVKLDRSLEESVNQLNQTTAELVARVNESDAQTRTMRTVSEENQVKLDQLARELSELKTTLYRQFNVTAPSGATMPPRDVEGQVGGVVIERAPGAAAQPPLASAMPQTPAAAPPGAAVSTPREEMDTLPPLSSAAGGAGDSREQYQQAQRTYANGDYTAALNLFDTYLQSNPNTDLSANAQFWKAKCYLNLDRYQESIQEFDKLNASFPASTKVPFSIHNQAVAYSRLGQTDRAIQLMQEVIDRYPVSAAAEQAKSDLQKLRGN